MEAGEMFNALGLGFLMLSSHSFVWATVARAPRATTASEVFLWQLFLRHVCLLWAHSRAWPGAECHNFD
jgi:hypothetical protein